MQLATSCLEFGFCCSGLLYAIFTPTVVRSKTTCAHTFSICIYVYSTKHKQAGLVRALDKSAFWALPPVPYGTLQPQHPNHSTMIIPNTVDLSVRLSVRMCIYILFATCIQIFYHIHINTCVRTRKQNKTKRLKVLYGVTTRYACRPAHQCHSNKYNNT